MKLIFATGNPNKINEIRKILSDSPWDISSLDELGIHEEIEETGFTLEENALLKARYIFQKTKQNVFSEDTGLEIAALNNKPGVRSARYAGEQASSTENIQLVLKELGEHTDRRARFRTIIALIIDGQEYLFEGIVEGNISHKKTGSNGFGYDPIFYPEGKDISFAQMSLQEKNKISHRYRALNKMIDFLKNQI